MVEQQDNTPAQPQPERYYSEYIRLAADNVSTRAIINERSSRGWKLLSAIQESSGDVLLIEWDISPKSFSK